MLADMPQVSAIAKSSREEHFFSKHEQPASLKDACKPRADERLYIREPGALCCLLYRGFGSHLFGHDSPPSQQGVSLRADGGWFVDH